MIVTKENAGELAWEKAQGLIPAVVQDADSGALLMQAFMDRDSLDATLKTGLVTFYSRSRQKIWQKGEESGNILKCTEISSDCDNDSLKVLAKPAGPVCHKGTDTCWDGSTQPSLAFLSELETIIESRQGSSPEESYTAKLFENGTKFIAQKVGEEAVETALAASVGDDQEVLEESADLVYHLLVLLRSRNLELVAVIDTLRKRHK